VRAFEQSPLSEKKCGKICGRAGVEGRGEVIVKLVMESSMKLILALE
jgi:hypothetical protein